jgi:TPR repeat protein
MTPAGDRPATMAARSSAPEARVTAPEAQPTAPETPKGAGDPEPARLMARASLLLGQGNIGVARVVLERAAEMGSAPALFALAETYDPAVLSAWGTFGTQGDVGKAKELYARAFAGGVQEARDRLNASRW